MDSMRRNRKLQQKNRNDRNCRFVEKNYMLGRLYSTKRKDQRDRWIHIIVVKTERSKVHFIRGRGESSKTRMTRYAESVCMNLRQ